jgi:transposase
MARAYSQDLRDRVIRTALGGVSVRQAAARYGVGVSTAILWVRRARSGEVTARRQGQPKGSKLDVHAAFLLELIETSSHISLQEMQTKLKEERGVSAGIGTLWRFFRARAITVKKKPLTPASATGPTSEPRAKLGSTGNWILTPHGWCSSTRPAPRPRWHVCTDAVREASACGLAFRTGIG